MRKGNMRLRYDDDFLEAAVMICAGGCAGRVHRRMLARFHLERERLYRVASPEERDEAFRGFHETWFRAWGLEAELTARLDEFPLVTELLQSLAFRKARGRKEEGSELYVSPGPVRHGVLAFRAERFADAPALERFLRHECMHLHDMVDPAFGYAAELDAERPGAVEQRLAAERYRVLWDITIDGRIVGAGYPVDTPKEAHRELLERAFAFWPAGRGGEVFDSLWVDPAPRHAKLAALAASATDKDRASGPGPGALCPLCGMPAFNWTDADAFDARLRDAVRRDFPSWEPSQGACLRCGEVYAANAARPVPHGQQGLTAPVS